MWENSYQFTPQRNQNRPILACVRCHRHRYALRISSGNSFLCCDNTLMGVVDLLLGRPLATEDEQAERIGPLKGIPIFGLDALSSAAYGPEAALTILLPLGLAGSVYIWPVSVGIVFLLGIVYFSYRQTIAA